MGGPKRAMSLVLIAAGALVASGAIVALVGLALPSDHVARMSIDLLAPPGEVWSLVSDLAGTARWRPEVQAVDVTEPSADGFARFTERGRHGATPFEVVTQEPTTRQVVRVLDEGLPFGGTWTWDLAPLGDGTRVSITEEGFVRNPLFRVMSRLFFPPTATMEAYLRALATELGEGAEPVVLRAR